MSTATTPSTAPPLSAEEQSIHEALDQSQQFDWKDDAIRIICASAVPHHPAYGISFEEYKNNRTKYSDDEQETTRIASRLPKFISRVSSDMAIMHKISHYRFIVLILELGMIHFKHDYADMYETIRHGREVMFNSLTTERNRMLYEQLDKQNIGMTCTSATRKLITPTVPLWLGDSVRETATYLNMSVSDFVFLCWCIGISKTIPKERIPNMIQLEITSTLSFFKFEFEVYSDRIIEITSKMSS